MYYSIQVQNNNESLSWNQRPNHKDCTPKLRSTVQAFKSCILIKYLLSFLIFLVCNWTKNENTQIIIKTN